MRKRVRGFTLVELLVSMAILSLMVLLAVGMLGNVAKIWTTGNQRSEIAQTARATIEMIGRDVSFAEPLPAQMQGNFKSYASSPLVINPPLPASVSLLKDTNGVPMDSLFFYSPLKTSSNGPLVCVGYFTTSDHTLKRVGVAASNTVYPSLAAANLPVYWMWNAGSANGLKGRDLKFSEFIQPVAWLNPATGKGFAEATVDGDVTSTVAERVLGFFVRPIGKDGKPLPSSLLPSTAPTCTSGSTLARAYNSAHFPVADGLPTEIEVTLAVCEAGAFERLKAQNALPLLTMPTDNSDAALTAKLNDLRTRLDGKVNQYMIVTRRFPILRGSR